MTDQRLHDLLHGSVSEASMPDVSAAAWRDGLRTRRRRTAGLAAGATALVVGVVGGVALVDRGRSEPGLSTGPPSQSVGTPTAPTTSAPTNAVTPYVPGDGAPDTHFRGLPVWWSPTLAQEAHLPAYPDSPLPATIDVNSGVTALTDHPIRRAVAAFAGVSDGIRPQYVVVLAPDGRQLAVDTSRVQPMTDPEGRQHVRVGPSLLSRSGQFLLFPQQHSLLIYTLRTGEWRTVHTGDAPTWYATWDGNTRISLADPARPLAVVPEYSVDGTSEGSGNVNGMGLPGIPVGSSQLYGRLRSGRDGSAQAFSAGAPIPEPPRSSAVPGSSDWINVNGTPGGILLLSAEAGRQKQCCQVDGWIGPDTVLYESRSTSGIELVAWKVGTGRFFQVARIYPPASGDVVTSFAQFAAARLPMPY
jgi:hypothetical protein